MIKTFLIVTSLAVLVSCSSKSSKPSAKEYLGKAVLKYQAGDYEEAAKLYSQAINIDPVNKEALYMRALAKTKLKNSKGAIADFTTLLELAPTDMEAMSLMAVEKLNVGDSLGAYEACMAITEMGSDDAEVYVRTGAIQIGLWKLDDAMISFRHAILLDPSSGSAYYHRGITHLYMGKKDLACVDWKRALELGFEPAKQTIEEECGAVSEKVE